MSCPNAGSRRPTPRSEILLGSPLSPKQEIVPVFLLGVNKVKHDYKLRAGDPLPAQTS